MKKLLIAMIFSSCLAANAQEIKTLEQDLAGEIGRVDLRSGIAREQANSIARYYGQRYIAGCGSTQAVVDRHSNWEATPMTGVGAIPDRNAILIGKHTGQISWRNGPTLSLTDLVESKEAVPKPVNRGYGERQNRSTDARASTVKIRFTVLPSGDTSDIGFEQSSKNPKCDLAARRIVENWKFPQRKQSIALVANVETCFN